MKEKIKGRIEFVGVNLRYRTNLPLALENVSFCIEPGMRVAIIGRTGSGKSSLLHVLLRAYEIGTVSYKFSTVVKFMKTGGYKPHEHPFTH